MTDPAAQDQCPHCGDPLTGEAVRIPGMAHKARRQLPGHRLVMHFCGELADYPVSRDYARLIGNAFFDRSELFSIDPFEQVHLDIAGQAFAGVRNEQLT